MKVGKAYDRPTVSKLWTLDPELWYALEAVDARALHTPRIRNVATPPPPKDRKQVAGRATSREARRHLLARMALFESARSDPALRQLIVAGSLKTTMQEVANQVDPDLWRSLNTIPSDKTRALATLLKLVNHDHDSDALCTKAFWRARKSAGLRARLLDGPLLGGEAVGSTIKPTSRAFTGTLPAPSQRAPGVGLRKVNKRARVGLRPSPSPSPSLPGTPPLADNIAQRVAQTPSPSPAVLTFSDETPLVDARDLRQEPMATLVCRL